MLHNFWSTLQSSNISVYFLTEYAEGFYAYYKVDIEVLNAQIFSL